jgi:hypothetical protein
VEGRGGLGRVARRGGRGGRRPAGPHLLRWPMLEASGRASMRHSGGSVCTAAAQEGRRQRRGGLPSRSTRRCSASLRRGAGRAGSQRGCPGVVRWQRRRSCSGGCGRVRAGAPGAWPGRSRAPVAVPHPLICQRRLGHLQGCVHLGQVLEVDGQPAGGGGGQGQGLGLGTGQQAKALQGLAAAAAKPGPASGSHCSRSLPCQRRSQAPWAPPEPRAAPARAHLSHHSPRRAGLQLPPNRDCSSSTASS